MMRQAQTENLPNQSWFEYHTFFNGENVKENSRFFLSNKMSMFFFLRNSLLKTKKKEKVEPFKLHNFL
jgi:hypothetical protein